ncbi:unnamed protein product [Coccothraustes coccothraustes]
MGAAPPPPPPRLRGGSRQVRERSALRSSGPRCPSGAGSPSVTALLRPGIPSRDGPLRRGPRQACVRLRPELPSDGVGSPRLLSPALPRSPPGGPAPLLRPLVLWQHLKCSVV